MHAGAVGRKAFASGPEATIDDVMIRLEKKGRKPGRFVQVGTSVREDELGVLQKNDAPK